MGHGNVATKSDVRETSGLDVAMGAPPMAVRTPPSPRTLAGIGIILVLIVAWAAFVASLSPFVGKWPVLVQAPYYLFVGVVWAIPLKPLIRWIQTGSFRVRH
ncbi:MAG: DUF2842 domain-containing protein [Myxococcales bacterium]|jgi:hypothetical protein